MRIHPLSDLHNEFAPFTPEVRDADVVILAGDIDLGTQGIEWARQAFDCPVLYVPGNHEFLAPRVEVYSIDEAFLDLTGLQEPLPLYGRRMKAEVQRLTGIPVGVGIAPTKTLAKLANWYAKKHTRSGVVDLSDPARQEKLLRMAPVGEVWGIGRKLSAKLEAMNVATAWDLAQQAPAFIRKAFSIGLQWPLR